MRHKDALPSAWICFLEKLSRKFPFFFVREGLIKFFGFAFVHKIALRCCIFSCNPIKVVRSQFLAQEK